ncbi:MAG TPA: DMT family transporter [Gaiellaceae bacterium]|nr:DMT family transporter [Gaiellaceae bacterium]
MAEILALVAAFFFALAATLQQKGALGLGEVSLDSPASLLRLAKQTWWLLGTVALLAGYVFQAIALANGRLAVIQPLLVTTIVFALPLGYFLTNQVIRRNEVAGAGVVVLGLAAFTVVGDAAEGVDNAPAGEWAIAVVVFSVVSVVLFVMGGRGAGPRKAALYGACAGILFGLSASLCKPTMEILGDDGVGAVLTSWEAYAFAVTGVVAFVVQQISLSKGNLAASVATVSVCNPLVSIVIGTLLLDERLAEPTWHKVVAYAGLGLALAGAAVISTATEGARDARKKGPAVPAPAT